MSIVTIRVLKNSVQCSITSKYKHLFSIKNSDSDCLKNDVQLRVNIVGK